MARYGYHGGHVSDRWATRVALAFRFAGRSLGGGRVKRRLSGKPGENRRHEFASGGGRRARGWPVRVHAVGREQIPSATLSAVWDGDDLTILLAGELDCATAPAISASLGQLLDAHPPRRLVLDMADVRFIDCAGLRPIIRACQALSADQRLIVRSPANPVRLLLAVTRLDQACLIEN